MKKTEELVDSELTCSLATVFSEKALDARQNGLPKWMVHAIHKLTYFFKREKAPVLYEKVKLEVEFTYQQKIPQDPTEKERFLATFSEKSRQHCLASFKNSNQI